MSPAGLPGATSSTTVRKTVILQTIGRYRIIYHSKVSTHPCQGHSVPWGAASDVDMTTDEARLTIHEMNLLVSLTLHNIKNVHKVLQYDNEFE